MAPAELEQTTADIEVNGRDGKAYGFRANGSVVMFDGFLKVYEEGRDERVRVIEKGKDDLADGGEDDSRRLPPLAIGDKLAAKAIDADQHFTQPPPRFTEATLVKRMEELGIGRPSTYASTMAVLVERDYVRMEKKQLVPEDKGRLVTAFLESFFKRYVEYDFTADLEEKLDLISDGKLKWKDVLRDFWRDFTGQVAEIKELRVTEVLDALNELLGPHVFPVKEDGSDPRLCPKCGKGQLSLKISGKNGAFVGCGNYPECNFTRQLAQTGADGEAAALDGKVLGIDPVTGKEVSLRNGRFGAYVQLGEPELDASTVVDVDAEPPKPKRGKAKPEKPKMIQPKRSSLPKGWDAASIDFERALKLLGLPRVVGEHPETKTPITAGARPLWTLHPARRHLRQRRKHRRSVRHRPQPRRHGAGREARGRRQGPLPARQTDGAEIVGRTSRSRRQDRRLGRQIRPLRQPQRRQRHGAESHRTCRSDRR